MRFRPGVLAAPAVGLAACVTFALLADRPAVEATAATATAIRFDTSVLNPAEPADPATVRTVAPGLDDIAPWISAVGAAVALADLDGNGHDDDVCLVDPRDDSVRLFPAPESAGALPVTELTPPGPPQPHVAPMGCVPGDLDEDGDQDVVVYYWGRTPVLWLNLGDGRRWSAVELTTAGEIWNTTALNLVDVDGDGHLDILVGNYFPDGARVLDPAAAGDDRMAMQDSMSLARNAGANRLLLTRPAGPDLPPRLTDASTAFSDTSARSWTLAFGAQDLTGDGLPELYVANDFGPDQLLVNVSGPGRPAFEERVGGRDLLTPKSYVLGRDSFKGMGVAFTHLDDDELPSIAVSNITTPYALHEANFLFEPSGTGADLAAGGVPYEQRAEQRGLARGGWSWDIKAGDFDNDGVEELIQATGFVQGEHNRWPELQELAMANDGLLARPGAWMSLDADADLSGHEPNRLWALRDDDRFHDVGAVSGVGLPDDVSRGFALGDVDGDGLVDILVANQWGPSRLHLNRTDDAGAGLALRLRQPAGAGTRPAVGASVVVGTGDERQYRQLFPANGHAGASGATLHVGLGDHPADVPVEVSVSWLDGSGRHTDVVTLRPGSHELLLQDSGEVTSS